MCTCLCVCACVGGCECVHGWCARVCVLVHVWCVHVWCVCMISDNGAGGLISQWSSTIKSH